MEVSPAASVQGQRWGLSCALMRGRSRSELSLSDPGLRAQVGTGPGRWGQRGLRRAVLGPEAGTWGRVPGQVLLGGARGPVPGGRYLCPEETLVGTRHFLLGQLTLSGC